ncbi:AsmA family protein [Sneathiella marina]|uniref:AsmA family protein n=1 Tax=Sneathiella marina TaxID=2950108 RepID=A0ABY4W4X6_9PROT|nr:AsmA family protein [Sneathiella marina]USG61874.1 AsmA family protein [Sneathiella marina]
MKKAIIALVSLVVIIVAAAVALPFIVPIDRVKQELVTAANDATGRELAIDGDFSLSIFPTLGVKASEVSFSNASGAVAAKMATIDSLVLELDLLPLLSGRIQVDEFVLTKPVINLEIDENGKANWIFDANQKKENTATETAKSDTESDSMDLGISDLNLGDVRIVDGSVSYIDQKSDTKIELADVNLNILLAGLDESFEAKGSAVWNQEKTDIDVKVGALRAILENRDTTTNFNMTSKNISLKYDGAVTTLDPLVLGGDTILDIPSVRQLAAWVGQPIKAEGDGFGPLNISGKVGVNSSKYSFTSATIVFDKINGVGDFSVDLSGKVPDITGKLALETLDLNPYLAAEDQETTAASQQSQSTSPTSEKWDSTPIDLDGLNNLNAKFDLSVQEILIKKIKIGSSALATTLKNGILDVGLTELNLYDGSGRGNIRVDATNPTLKISNSFTIENVQLQPLLTDAADFKKLSGKGLVQIDTTTVGKSQAEMVNALNGEGQILFEDGSISGINLAAMARNVATAFTDSGEAQKTDFAELSGTFDIKNGILTNNDLTMFNPFIRLSGEGTVELPPKTLNYRIEPKLVATTEGQGGTEKSGLAIPINVSGSWDNLKFAPDLKGVLKNVTNPDGVKDLLDGAKGSGDGLKDALKGAKSGDKEAVKGLLDAAGSLFGKKK